MRIPALLALSSLLTGCATQSYTGTLAPDAVERANENFTRIESQRARVPERGSQSRLLRLFEDRLDYVALLYETTDGKRLTAPRVKTMVPPAYPAGKMDALVEVAFVVSETGSVEEARVYSTTDERFSAAAVTAVKAWTFHPSIRNGIPWKYLLVVPVKFERAKD